MLVAHAGGPTRKHTEIRLVTQKSERNDGLMATEYILKVYDLKFTVS